MNGFMGMEMSNINFNFQKVPNKFIKINNNQQRKSREETSIKYKDKFINESLVAFSKEENNKILDELVNNLINFRKKCINQEEKDIKIKNTIINNYLLFHNVEKNLIEISYLTNREHRQEKIKNLYEWYQSLLNKNKILKRIKSKSFKSVNEKYDLNNSSKLPQSFSRNKCFSLASAKIQKSDVVINSKNNLSWNFMTHFHPKEKCANNNSEIITNYFKTPKPCQRIFFPVIKETHFHLEKDILDNKLKILREKRHLEEINIQLNKFGMNRAKFKEYINNKYEMKELIRLYVNENKNDTDINNSKLLKKYLNKKIKIKNINVIKNNADYKSIKGKERIFYGINHTKIFMNRIKNINKDTKKIIDNASDMYTMNIKMKISGKDIKLSNILSTNAGDKSLFKEKLKNKNISNDLIKIDSSYKTDLNAQLENNNFEEEEKRKKIKFNLSLFHTDNINKIHLYKNKYKPKNIFRKVKSISLNLNEKKKFEMYNNYSHNKSDFLSIRKSMEILNKIDYNQIITKNENKKLNLSKAFLTPKNNKSFSLYYFPRPESKLLAKVNN